MHMPSRKDLDLAELETVRLSRNPTTVMTANGEVQTNEEATVYAFDFVDLFLTVQVLEDTPAVPSLGTLSEDHGYFCEWTSGQKPHLLLNDRKIQCNTENHVPIVVRGLSTGPSSPSTSASSTSASQDSMGDDSTPSPATTRSRSTRSRALGDQLHDSTETDNKKKNEDIDEARRRPLRDLPGWREESTENLVEEDSASSEAPASISREPLHQEPLIKLVLGTHSIFARFPKDRNCEVCKRTQITSALRRHRAGNQVRRAEKFGDLIKADHTPLSEGCES